LTPKQRETWIESVLALAVEIESGKAVKPAPSAKISLNRKKPALKPKPAQISSDQSLDASITTIKGISTGFAAKFGKLGVRTIRDLLYFFPGRHVDYSQMKTVSQLREGQEETIVANVGGQNHDAGRTAPVPKRLSAMKPAMCGQCGQ